MVENIFQKLLPSFLLLLELIIINNLSYSIASRLGAAGGIEIIPYVENT
jgi:hypothetical protein